MLLNCHSFYSLRYGTLSIEKLVEQASDFGFSSLALTDINATTGVYDFILECQHKKIKPVIGIDFRNGNQQLFTALARNREGFKELNELLTKHNFDKSPLPSQAPSFEHCYVIYPYEVSPNTLRENEYVGVRYYQLNKVFRTSIPKSKLVPFHSITFSNPDGYHLHQLLRGVDLNTIRTKLKPGDICGAGEYLVSIDRLINGYRDHAYMILNANRILEDCNFDYDFKTLKNKKYYTNNRSNDKELLEQLAYEGMKTRYGADHKEAKARIIKEIDIIDKMGFAGYFLITWDIVRYSISRGFYHVGRGSGANSIVSYCLNITNCCPLELNLYFERFLNPSRISPPDFDIDWSWKDRDEILNYIFKRFNSECTAFMGTIGTFKHRSIVRELGKVYGLPKEELDILSKTSVSEHHKDSVVSKLHFFGKQLEGFPNMRSLHACGIIISEEPLTYYTALDMPPKGFATAQFDMYIGEEIGFEKWDVLSQRGIGHINDCVDLVAQNQGKQINIHQTKEFKKDSNLNQLLSVGKTIGCFYIESPAMRGLLRRLQCKDYETLVAASSIIRPGVAKSGMMREYVFRHNNPSKFEYFHEVFEKQLGDTYGVMVYQEDVLKIAHHFAGLDLADADVLRRAMSGKTRSKKQFEAVKSRFFENCEKKGFSAQLSNEVYRQIESFAGYSFCKAHSASYAVESYQSLHLKTYYPLEFMVSVINNFGGFYRTEVYIHEARVAGADIQPPCVNRSTYLTSIEDKTIYLGFIHLQNFDEKLALQIEKVRMSERLFSSFEDFIHRISIGIETAQVLIYIGAFRFTGLSKSELILKANLILSVKSKKVMNHSSNVQSMFEPEIKNYMFPTLERSMFEDAFDEIELLGFTVSCTPFDLLQTTKRGDVMVKELVQHQDKTIRMIGYLISRKYVPTKHGTMNFGTWVDVNGDFFDTTHFPKVFKDYPFIGGGCYLILGKVDLDFGFPSIVVEKLARLPFVPDPRYPDDQIANQNSNAKIQADLSTTHRAPYPSEHEIGLPRQKMI